MNVVSFSDLHCLQY